MPPQNYFEKRLELLLPPKTPMVNLQHQLDQQQRDALFEEDLSSVQTPPSFRPKKTQKRPSSFVKKLKQGFLRMNELLADHQLVKSPFTTRDPSSQVEQADQALQHQTDAAAARRAKNEPYTTDVNLISAASMHQFYLHRKHRQKAHNDDSEVLVASLKEIQYEIQRRQNELAAVTMELSALYAGLSSAKAREAKYRQNDELVIDRLSEKWKEFRDLFSTRASDDLAAKRPAVDHKIKLTGKNTLTTEPLRRMPDKYFAEAKRYITENLYK